MSSSEEDAEVSFGSQSQKTLTSRKRRAVANVQSYAIGSSDEEIEEEYESAPVRTTGKAKPNEWMSGVGVVRHACDL